MTPTIETARLALVPFGERHLTQRYVGWLNDRVTVRFSELRHATHTLRSCADYAAGMAKSGHLFWAIERQPDGTHIGNLTAYLDRANGLADLAILIGEPDARGAGFGREAWKAACDWLAGQSWVRKICAGTLAANRPMLRAMEAAGMAVEAVRKDHHFVEGHAMDVVYAARFIR
ncbi:MAG: GNAT family N-acetyltransferase [Rhodospirillales bacterium]|nr:GNAT family N-acetyltransferase [Rhodospirillales bacterium]